MNSKQAGFAPVALMIFLLDQLGKSYATRTLAEGEYAPLVGNLLSLANTTVSGGALGLFADFSSNAQGVGFALLSIIATVVIASFYRGLAPREFGSAAGLGAILGGIFSHSLDRFRYGWTVDFLHWGSPSADVLPDFNLADLAIVLGVVTLIVELLATEMATRASERPRR